MIYDSRLEELAQRLGADAAERLDVERAARSVVQRLKDEPAERRRPTWAYPTWLRIAAALVIVVGGVVVASRLIPGRSSAGKHVAHFVADDLSDLSTDQLQDVLTSFDDFVASDSVAVPESSTDLRELNAQQLRAVLRSLEG